MESDGERRERQILVKDKKKVRRSFSYFSLQNTSLHVGRKFKKDNLPMQFPSAQ